MEGRVIAAHGRQYVVELADGTLLPCFPRGKKSEIACGDRVDIMRTSDDQGVVEAIQPRVSLLYRSNEIRQKLIAANVDQIVIVVATEPAFSDELVARALLAAESEEILGAPHRVQSQNVEPQHLQVGFGEAPHRFDRPCWRGGQGEGGSVHDGSPMRIVPPI